MSPSGTLDPSAGLIEEHCRVGIPELALCFCLQQGRSHSEFPEISPSKFSEPG